MTPQGNGIRSKAICLNLTVSRLGTRRRVPSGMVEADVQDKTLLKVAKVILDADALDAVGRVDGQAKAWLYARALESPLFRAGIYLIPLGLVEEVDAKLKAVEAERATCIDAFLAMYDAIRDNARVRLAGLFDPTDYPSVAAVRATFGMRWQWIGFDAPAQLESLNRELWQREREKAGAAWAEAADDIRLALRATCAELVAHLAERLQPAADGKRRVFRDSAVTNLTQFLDLFDKRDVTSDAELQALVGQARAILSGVDAEMLRGTDRFRSRMRDALLDVKTALDGLVQTGGRKISLADDEEAA